MTACISVEAFDRQALDGFFTPTLIYAMGIIGVANIYSNGIITP